MRIIINPLSERREEDGKALVRWLFENGNYIDVGWSDSYGRLTVRCMDGELIILPMSSNMAGLDIGKHK